MFDKPIFRLRSSVAGVAAMLSDRRVRPMRTVSAFGENFRFFPAKPLL
ncbi:MULTISPECIES: hypothetical protein [Bradyrhizobium]|nr:hypothetical protein [Bradyrhizobium elkanii]WLA45577.1 hypothetical protein QIH80_27485 [Bradyrhizobium elkanii]WLB84165.1 hypothetical protein QIH83_17125 [Bradyrhizobium elkanii]